jgi:hypothetical protein
MFPQLESQPRNFLARVIKQLIGPQGNWKTKDLEKAMDAIEKGFMSLKKASWYWNILLISLSNQLIGKIMSRKRGPS